MSDPRHDKLPDDVRGLLDDAGDEPAPDAAAKDRLWSRLGTTLDLPPLDGPEGNPGGDGNDGGATPGAASAGASAGAAKAGWAAAIATNPVPFAVTMFALGAASGIAFHATVMSPEVPIAAPLPPSEPVTIAQPPPTGIIEPSPTPAPTVAVRRKPGVPVEAVATPDDALAEERSLVEMARTALSRKEPSAALDAAREHERRFPTGRLAEERDFIRIQALVALGQADDARAAFARFESDHPRSFFTPSLRQALTPKASE